MQWNIGSKLLAITFLASPIGCAQLSPILQGGGQSSSYAVQEVQAYEDLLANPIEETHKNEKRYSFSWSNKVSSKHFSVVSAYKDGGPIAARAEAALLKNIDLAGPYVVRRLTPTLETHAGLCDRSLTERMSFLYQEFRNGRDGQSSEYVLQAITKVLGDNHPLYLKAKERSDNHFDELLKASATCYAKKLATRKLPANKLNGPERATFEKFVKQRWSDKYPQDKILQVIFTTNVWKPFTDTRVNWGAGTITHQKYSVLNSVIAIKKDATTATLFLVEVMRDHLNNGAIVIGVPTKERAARDDILLKNF